MSQGLLTVNAGSSSIKFALFEAGAESAPPRLAGQIEGVGVGAGAISHVQALQQVLERLRSADTGGVGQHIVAVGHRIVHGGTGLDGPALIDAEVLARIEALAPLAPLHQPHNLAGVRAAQAAFPQALQVACFDTAFHRHQPAVFQRFALPQRWHDAGVQRYGFHGLSYQSVIDQFAASEPELAAGRVVIAHLGNGASMCGLRGGRSVATTMSFSPLDGLTMGTRCGRIDAEVVLHLMRNHGLDVEAVSTLLHRESGLLGLSGESSDMRALLASPSPAAALAVEHFVEAVLRELAMLGAALRGIDALVFTGGIGENAAVVRERICAGAAWLGLALDGDANRARSRRLDAPGSTVALRLIPTNEEAVIVRQTASIAEMAKANSAA